MSSDVAIGKILDDSAQRDAVHFAIAPVVAAGNIQPGYPIGLLEDGTERVAHCHRDCAQGIADPFLKGMIEEGQRFYMFLYPNTVTGMRHHWQHPSFQDQSSCLKTIERDS